MSYYLCHEISITNIATKKDAERIIKKFNDEGFEDVVFGDIQECHCIEKNKTTYSCYVNIFEGHYEMEPFLCSLSRQAQGVIFTDEVTDHEDVGAKWRNYVKNGKSVCVSPYITWPDFEDAMLDDDYLPF